MPADVAIGCTCGAFTGVIRGVTPANARRLVCICDDCQVYARYLRRGSEVLDAHGGTELIYATQNRFSLSTGRERLLSSRELDALRAQLGHRPAPSGSGVPLGCS